MSNFVGFVWDNFADNFFNFEFTFHICRGLLIIFVFPLTVIFCLNFILFIGLYIKRITIFRKKLLNGDKFSLKDLV